MISSLSTPNPPPGMPRELAEALGPALLAMGLGQVDRATWHPDLSAETVSTHTVMVAVLCRVYLDKFPNRLDFGRVMWFAIIHDLAEVFAGDTNTAFGLTKKEREAKEKRERIALERIRREVPWLGAEVAAYEAQKVPEARFVRVVDKFTPKLTHYANDFEAIRAQGMDPVEMRQQHDMQLIGLQKQYPELHPLLLLLRDVCRACEDRYRVVWDEGRPMRKRAANPTTALRAELMTLRAMARESMRDAAFHVDGDTGDGLRIQELAAKAKQGIRNLEWHKATFAEAFGRHPSPSEKATKEAQQIRTLLRELGMAKVDGLTAIRMSLAHLKELTEVHDHGPEPAPRRRRDRIRDFLVSLSW